jgi:hypothetical protein
MIMIWTYAAYLVVSVALTIWVGRTLHRNGRVFLVDALHGNEKLADSVNHLLLVGFYLVNIGFMALALKYGGQVLHVQGAIEYLSTKLGIVLLVLGGMHFFNLAVLSGMRRRAVNRAVDALPAELVNDDRGYRGRLRMGAVPVDR